MNYVKFIVIEKDDTKLINEAIAGNPGCRGCSLDTGTAFENGAEFRLRLEGAGGPDGDASPGAYGSFKTPEGTWSDTGKEQCFFGVWGFPGEGIGGNDMYYIFVVSRDDTVPTRSGMFVYK